MALAEHHFISRAFPMFSIKFKALCLLVMLAGAVEAFAWEKTFHFRYRPDSANPNSNAFVYVGAPGCDHGTTLPPCRANEYATGLVPTLAAPVSAGPASRSTPMFRTSTEWRQISLTNGDTGHLLTAELRLVGATGHFEFSPGLTELVPEAHGNSYLAYDLLFGHAGAWSSPPSPCVGRRPGHSGANESQPYSISTSSTPCMLPLTKDVPSLHVSSRFIYEIKLPRPREAQAGRYTGMVTYTTGPNMDIDLGDSVLFQDTELRLNLRLDVDAILNVEFPGGSNLLSLEPEGGWLNWLHRGRKPTRLWREQAFNLTTSIPFKMKLECEHTSGDHCAIAASDGHTVPVETRLTLPAGMQDTAGRPVRDYLMSRHDTPQFNPAMIILGRQGKVHFEVPKPDMETMLDHAGKAYSGAVTLTWDAQL